MTTPIKLAVRHKLEHPDESYSTVANKFSVSKSTLHDHTAQVQIEKKSGVYDAAVMEAEEDFWADSIPPSTPNW
jgi:hypothetical protein